MASPAATQHARRLAVVGLLDLPAELIVRIAVYLGQSTFLGPPHQLIPLQAVCKSIHTVLSTHSTQIQASLFRSKFDTYAARRRLGPDVLHNTNLAHQFRKQWVALKRIRDNGIRVGTVESDLWTAYVMMLENDGKNMRQLCEWADIRSYVMAIIRERIWEDRSSPNGYPVESCMTSLAMWLLWMTSTQETIAMEDDDIRREIINLVWPWVIAAYRYPSFHSPDIYYYLPHDTTYSPYLPTSVLTAHGHHPLNHSPRLIRSILHYNAYHVTLGPPTSVAAAQLIYFSRRNFKYEMNYLESIGVPPTRQDAVANFELGIYSTVTAGGLSGPTQVDYEEINEFDQAKLCRWADYNEGHDPIQDQEMSSPLWNPYFTPQICRNPSSRWWDADWDRITTGWDPDIPISQIPSHKHEPIYTYGSLVGTWSGKFLLPVEDSYLALVRDAELPEGGFREDHPLFISLRHFHMTVREHHYRLRCKACSRVGSSCRNGVGEDGYSINMSPVPVPVGQEPSLKEDEGIRNAWFPPGVQFKEGGGQLTVTDPGSGLYIYDTHVPGKKNDKSKGKGRMPGVPPSMASFDLPASRHRSARRRRSRSESRSDSRSRDDRPAKRARTSASSSSLSSSAPSSTSSSSRRRRPKLMPIPYEAAMRRREMRLRGWDAERGDEDPGDDVVRRMRGRRRVRAVDDGHDDGTVVAGDDAAATGANAPMMDIDADMEGGGERDEGEDSSEADAEEADAALVLADPSSDEEEGEGDEAEDEGDLESAYDEDEDVDVDANLDLDEAHDHANDDGYDSTDEDFASASESSEFHDDDPYAGGPLPPEYFPTPEEFHGLDDEAKLLRKEGSKRFLFKDASVSAYCQSSMASTSSHNLDSNYGSGFGSARRAEEEEEGGREIKRKFVAEPNDEDGEDEEVIAVDDDEEEVCESCGSSCRDGGVRDVIFTGETEHRHGMAWGNYKFYGRVRPYDGLISLVRVGTDEFTAGQAGTLIFRGYLHGSQNFTGKWRFASYGTDEPTLEGAFTMSRM